MSIRIGDMYYQLCEEQTEVSHDLPYTPVRKRLKGVVPNRIIVHWTGGRPDRTIKRFVQILNRSKVRGLGYHFVIDAEATIWQLADPLTDKVSHAGGKDPQGRSLNEHTVGVGFIGAGTAKQHWHRNPLAASESSSIHGKVREYQLPSAAQLRALCALLETLTEQMGIPRTIDTKTQTVMTSDQFELAHVIGHHQVSLKKTDPGPWVMEQIDEFFNGLAMGYEEGTV